MKHHSAIIGVAILLSGGASASGSAQAIEVRRFPLQDQAFPAPLYHTAMIRAVIEAGAEVPPHTHPGIELAYIVSGRASLTIAGQPPRMLDAGDDFAIPLHAVHSLRNIGTGPLTVISTYVVKQGEPLAGPAR